MTTGIRTIIYPVENLAQAKMLFSALLGVEPETDEPYYVGFAAAGQQVGLDPKGHSRGMTGPVPFWHVEDIRSSLNALVTAGAETVQDIQDVGGGMLTATVRDTDGNPVGLIQAP
ncbi:VOC family protein [Streptomyces hypolithicus]